MMSTPSGSDEDNDTTRPDKGYSLETGLQMGALGFKMVPIRPGAKYPNIKEWQKEATDDEATIRGWFTNTRNGIGWAMGRQPNGMNLVTVDVDAHGAVDGTQSLTRLIAENNPRSAASFTRTVNAITGGDGAHFVFEVPDDVEVRNTQHLAPGIDIRGEGGQIVIAPTIHPDTGQPYRWQRSPWKATILTAPAWLVALMTGPPPAPAANRVPDGAPKGVSLSELVGGGPVGGDITPADWVAENFPFQAMLEMAGWMVEKVRGDEVWLKRPGKSDTGHSAVLHDGRVLNIFSTEAPANLLAIGKQSRDVVSVSAFDFLAAEQFGGDHRAAASWVRTEKMGGGNRVGMTVPASPAGSPTGTSLPKVVLDDEFWQALPFLTHIRQAAWSRMVSPDAALLSVLARVSALTPPTLRLPAVIGSVATLDFIGCIVARSSGGKSISNDLAAELLPSSRKDVLLDLPIGSGEGLVQSFLVPEVGDDGKPTGKQIVGIDGIHFTVDEGTALMEQHKRQGTTIVQTLCSAWSGRALGQANASIETRRIIEPRRVRMAAIINIQTSNGYLLLDDKMIAVGFPQRLVFAHAEDPTLPEVLPEWPGAMKWAPPAKITGGSLLTVAPEIVEYLRQLRRQVVTGALILGALDGHGGLMQLKLAGLITVCDHRQAVTWADWLLAGQILASSLVTRDIIVSTKVEHDRDTRHRRAVAVADDSEVAQEHLRQKKIAQAVASIPDILERHGPLKRKALKNKMYAALRFSDILSTALQTLVDLGKIVERDGEWHRVEV